MKNYEQIISTLLAKIADLEKLVIQQATRIAELEKRLDKNSRNSSKPPSSEKLWLQLKSLYYHLLRLFHYKQDVLRFLHDPAVPFTNNDAERDLRMMKCKQKISGGFRSMQGAEQFARIRGFISTVRKQGLNILSSIQSVFSGNILTPAGC
jgi:Transposase IS66 family/Family of unknown function (DUF6444)